MFAGAVKLRVSSSLAIAEGADDSHESTGIDNYKGADKLQVSPAFDIFMGADNLRVSSSGAINERAENEGADTGEESLDNASYYSCEEEGGWMSKTELEAIIVQSCLQASRATSTQVEPALESRLWQLKEDYAECLYTSSKLEREIEDNAADFEAWSEVICKLHTKEPKSQQEKKIIDDCLNMRRHYAAARRNKAAQMT